jgi:hypothetical protein
MDLLEVGDFDPAGHWYYISKKRLLGKFFTAKSAGVPILNVVDVGAGSAFFSKSLVGRSGVRNVFAVDINYHEAEVGFRDGVTFSNSMISADELSMGATLWLLMDVLEHVDDDVGFLRNVVEGARDDDTFLVTVPAFNFLWSPHDEYLGHRRRYTTSSLRNLLSAVGVEYEEIGYFYVSIFPVAVVARWLSSFRNQGATRSSLRKHSWLLNKSLQALLWLEFCVTSGFCRLPGLTVVATARKLALSPQEHDGQGFFDGR